MDGVISVGMQRAKEVKSIVYHIPEGPAGNTGIGVVGVVGCGIGSGSGQLGPTKHSSGNGCHSLNAVQ